MTLALKMADARYDGYEEGFDEGFTAGREDGLQQGAYETKLETAKMFLSYGDSPEKVASCTKLPLDVVQNLIQVR